MSTLKFRMLAGIWSVAIVMAVSALAVGAEMVASKNISLQLGKLDEADASSTMDDPNFGYVGELGSFEVTTKDDAQGKRALGTTKLQFLGSKRIGNLDGWVFKTQWDGESYPSKIFFSADQVYFGGGVSGYIAGDYREGTGWVWKLLPLRRTELVQNN